MKELIVYEKEDENQLYLPGVHFKTIQETSDEINKMEERIDFLSKNIIRLTKESEELYDSNWVGISEELDHEIEWKSAELGRLKRQLEHKKELLQRLIKYKDNQNYLEVLYESTCYFHRKFNDSYLKAIKAREEEKEALERAIKNAAELEAYEYQKMWNERVQREKEIERELNIEAYENLDKLNKESNIEQLKKRITETIALRERLTANIQKISEDPSKVTTKERWEKNLIMINEKLANARKAFYEKNLNQTVDVQSLRNLYTGISMDFINADTELSVMKAKEQNYQNLMQKTIEKSREMINKMEQEHKKEMEEKINEISVSKGLKIHQLSEEIMEFKYLKIQYEKKMNQALQEEEYHQENKKVLKDLSSVVDTQEDEIQKYIRQINNLNHRIYTLDKYNHLMEIKYNIFMSHLEELVGEAINEIMRTDYILLVNNQLEKSLKNLQLAFDDIDMSDVIEDLVKGAFDLTIKEFDNTYKRLTKELEIRKNIIQDKEKMIKEKDELIEKYKKRPISTKEVIEFKKEVLNEMKAAQNVIKVQKKKLDEKLKPNKKDKKYRKKKLNNNLSRCESIHNPDIRASLIKRVPRDHKNTQVEAIKWLTRRMIRSDKIKPIFLIVSLI